MSNGTFTAPVTGRYLVCINVEFTEVDTIIIHLVFSILLHHLEFIKDYLDQMICQMLVLTVDYQCHRL